MVVSRAAGKRVGSVFDGGSALAGRWYVIVKLHDELKAQSEGGNGASQQLGGTERGSTFCGLDANSHARCWGSENFNLVSETPCLPGRFHDPKFSGRCSPCPA